MNWELLVLSAFAVLGTIEWIKGFFKQAPAFVWRILLPVACIGMLFVPNQVRLGLCVLSLTQIGYDTFVAIVKQKIGVKE